MDNDKCGGTEDVVRQRLDKLNEQWDELNGKSDEKSKRLQEANRQVSFQAGVKDIEFWLGEVSDAPLVCCLRILTFLVCCK